MFIIMNFFQIVSVGSVRFKGCYREAVWPFLAIGQMFGVMPLSGLNVRSQLHFKWKSLQTIYSLIVVTILITYSIFLIWRTIIHKDSNYSAICNYKFNTIIYLVYVYFITFQLFCYSTYRIHASLLVSLYWHWNGPR